MDISPTQFGPKFLSLGEMVETQSQHFPQRAAFVFEDDAGESESWSYAMLGQRARTLGAWLSKRVSAGDRVMLVYPPGLEFIAAFFGCVYAGVLPVPATYPKPRRPLPRLDSIVVDCEPTLVLTHSTALAGLSLELLSPACSELVWESTDLIATDPNCRFEPLSRSGDDLAFLQYTSGSTAEPQGVMVSHANVLHNLSAIRTSFGITPNVTTNAVFWLPAYHDMGLIGGILSPLFAGGTCTLIAPATFLRQPQRWLELISTKRATISGGPNFAYDLVVRKTTVAERAALDLSHWRLAFCGAEPINPDTLTEFASAFACANFKPGAFFPCYGLAESTLLVTGGQLTAGPRVLQVDRKAIQNHEVVSCPEKNGHTRSLVGCGPTCEGMTVEIVNPTSKAVCANNEIGEIWVRGESIARGYWNKSQATADTFRARLEANGSHQTSGSEFLRTGDLGFRYQGELFITGRLKDVIIVRGRNHYPQDLERTAELSHEAIDTGAAFSVDVDGSEELVMVHQWRRDFRHSDQNEMIQRIRAAVVAEHEIDPHAISLIRPASLPITSSGKVQRQRCREQFLNGELAVTTEWVNVPCQGNEFEGLQEQSQRPPDFLQHLGHLSRAQLQAEIQAWLVAWLSSRANLPPGAVRPAVLFAQLGIDSLTAVEISQELDQILGLQSPPMVIWTCPTPAELAEYLTEQLQNSSTRVG